MKTFDQLTKSQQKQVESLMRLGDSKELAIKTVLNLKNKSSEIYQAAYYS